MRKSEKGFSLLEVVIAILILAILAAGFLGALSGASKALVVTNERQKAMTLAQDQMEYVKNKVYAQSYTPSPVSSEYAGYSVSILTDNVTSRDKNIQSIRITVSHQGKPIIVTAGCTLEGYKVN